MKLNKISIIFLLIFCCLFCTCKSISTERKTAKANVAENYSVFHNISDSIICNNADSVYFTKIKYTNDTIYVVKDKKIIFKTDYVFDEKVLPFDALITSEDTLVHCYYIYQKKYLFIPVNEVNNRWNMLIVNLHTKQEIHDEYRYMTDTVLNWFYFDIQNGLLVCSNSINYDGKTRIDYYKIINNKMVLQKSKKVYLDDEICLDFWKFRQTVKL
ncbi:MAG: hypothetical protein LBG92_06595 [Prevotellaceae bacterium]|jgi:hypothetical protein|nr:hypothetical protein [Prevotellaceae bacterium]